MKAKKEDVKIDYSVYKIWEDAVEAFEPIDEQRAAEILRAEMAYCEELYEDEDSPAYGLLGISPEEFCEQWNWLAERRPETMWDIPKENRG